MVELGRFSDLGISFSDENIVSKIAKEQLELGIWNFASSLEPMCSWPEKKIGKLL